MRTIVAILLLTSLLACAHAQYTVPQLQSDYANTARLGAIIYAASVQASEQLSDSLFKDNKLTTSFTVNDLTQLRAGIAKLPTTPDTKPGLAIAPRRYGLRPDAPVVVQRPGVTLTHLTWKFQLACTIMARNLSVVADNGDELRTEFARLLQEPANKQDRWHFVGVTELVANAEALQGNASASALAQLLPAMHKEAAAAAMKINWKFGHLVAQAPQTADKLHGFAVAQKPVKMSQVVKRGPGERPDLVAPRVQTPAAPAMSPKQAKGFWGNVWNDITAGAGEDWDQGTQIGSVAGQVIGAVAGGMAGSALGPGGVVPVAVETMEVGEAYGYLAGGVVGVIGGAIGTTAGWICGTIEGHLANRNATMKRGIKRGGPMAQGTGPVAEGADAQAPDSGDAEMIQLF